MLGFFNGKRTKLNINDIKASQHGSAGADDHGDPCFNETPRTLFIFSSPALQLVNLA